eukprot:g10432.t1
MPEPAAAGSWGLTSLTGFLEGSVLNVFASGSAEKAEGAGEEGPGGAGGGVGAMQVQQQTSKPMPEGVSQKLCDDASSLKPNRTASSASLESDLPELGRLERTKTPTTSVPTSDEEPALPTAELVVARGADRPAAGKQRVSANVKSMEAKGRTAPAAPPFAQAHKASKVPGRQSTVAAVKPAAAGGLGGGATTTAGRWARTGGIASSSASTLVPGMSPAITPAASRGAEFGSRPGPAPALNKAGSSEDSSGTDDNNDKRPTTTAVAKTNSRGSSARSNASNIPAPLDLSAIAAPTPPLNRHGGKFGSSGSSASKPVVLQGAALESLKRLGRPGSSVSDLSSRLGSNTRGPDMTVPLGAAIPMAVPLGAVVRPVGSNSVLSGKKQKQLRSREISKDFHTTGSYGEKGAQPESMGSSLSGPPAWTRSESGASSSRGREGPTAGIGNGGSAIEKTAIEEDNGSSSDDNPPPPSPMLTAHLRGPQPANKQPQPQQRQQQPAGRGRTFKGRGVRPQTWNEEDGAAAAAAATAADALSPLRDDGEGQRQQQQQQQQNQMRLVARNPGDASANHDTFLNGQVSPGALSMVSCSTVFSRHSRGGGGGSGDPGFNDSAKHLDTLAEMDLARRNARATAAAMPVELAPGLGRGAFEDISMSPSIPLRGNDLAGVSKAMPSNAVPAAPVGEVPSLAKRKAALSSNAGTSSSSSSSFSRRSRAAGGRPHVLAAQGSRSGPLDDSLSASPHADPVPSLTVAHAPGKVYQPAIGGGPPGGAGAVSHHHKRVGRGTPATHTNGIQPPRGGGDGTAPFRLPSNIRLTSFGSRASSILSPQKGSGADWGEHHEQGKEQRKEQEDLGEDTSELARRPKVIDMLSTFGSHSYSRSENPAAVAASVGRPRSGVGGEDKGGGGHDKDQRRRNASSTRRSKRGDRISQRRSRSSASQVGGSRRFNSGSIVAESDVRSSRDRRRSASRSMSGGESLVAEERATSRRDATHDPVDLSKVPAIGNLAALGGSSQAEHHASASSAGLRGAPDDKAKDRSLSPARSQSFRSGNSSNSSRRNAVSPSTLSTSSRRRSARGGGATATATATGKHHRRRSSGIHGAMANKSIFVAAPAATSGAGAGERRSTRGSRSPRSRSRSPRPEDKGACEDKPSAADEVSSRRRRSRKDAGDAVLAPPREAEDAAGEPTVKYTAGDVKAAEAAAAVATVVVGQEDPTNIDVVPQMRPVSASRAVDGSGGQQRRWSKSSKKPSTANSSNPRSSGARKTATIKKRKVQRFLAIASLFRKTKNRSCSSSCSSSDAGDDDGTAVATAVGANPGSNNNGHRRGFTRSESTELANAARRSQFGGGFAGWLWRAVTRQRGRTGGGTGRRSPASSGGGGGRSPLTTGATSSLRPRGEERKGGPAAAAKAGNSQHAPPHHRLSARRPTSRGSGNSGQGSHHGSGAGGCGAPVVGGCITQFYDAPAADENDTVEGSGGGADLKFPSAEEAAEARARVQQLLRTSQVHMKKHSSMRSGSFPADVSSGAAAAVAAAPSSTVAAGGGGGGRTGSGR